MSSKTGSDTPTNSNVTAKASTTSHSGSSKPQPFNYAAAAAKSKQTAAPVVVAAGSSNDAAGSTANTGASASVAQVNGSAAVNGVFAKPGEVNGADAQQRGQSAVSIPKAANTALRTAASINFGSVQDAEATLSVSPAQPPVTGHIGKPAAFGSVNAMSTSNVGKDKGLVIGTKENATTPAAPKPKMDFQKLFQNPASQQPSALSGTQATPAASTAATPDAASTPGSSLPSASNSPVVANASMRSPPSQQQHLSSSSRLPGAPPVAAAGQPSALRPPGQSRDFQPGQRNPSGGQPPYGSRMQAGPAQGVPPQYAGYAVYHGGSANGLRSPSMMQMYPMPQPFPGYNPYMQQQQQPPPPQPQQFPGSPAHWAPPSPRPPVGATQGAGQPGLGGAAQQQGGAARPPQSPAPSMASLASPPPQQAGFPSVAGVRPGHIHTPSGSFAGSHSAQSSISSVSAGAPAFLPRANSAIKIVDPLTNQVVNAKVANPKPAASTASSSRPSTPGLTAPSAPAGQPATPDAAPASPSPSPSVTSFAAPSKIQTQQSFIRAVNELKKASDEKKLKEEEEARKKREEEAAAKKKEEEEAAAAAQKKEEEERAKLEEEEKKRKQQEAEERRKREEEERLKKEEDERKAATEAKRKAEEVAAKAQAEREEREAKEAAESQAEAKDAEEKAKRPAPVPIDTSLDEMASRVGKSSVADVERMAREASSVPSTPLLSIPPTPRTPGTPGFASLPAKPQVQPSSSSIKLDTTELEKRRRPDKLDLTSTPKGVTSDTPMSAALQALGSANRIEDLSKVQYPSSIKSPRPDLNDESGEGRFRYDREFLLQFMGVFKEKPRELPPLGDIGMEPGRGSTFGKRAPGIGGGAAPGRGPATGLGIGVGGGSAFGKPPAKSSEERFAQSTAGSRGSGMGNFGGPMGAFQMGRGTQPLSRGGSGSGAIPSREMMGRTSSKRGGRKPDGAPGRGPYNPPEKGGPTILLSEVMPLEKSANRWAPQVQTGKGAGLKADSPEMVQRKVKALLNKLTLDNFDSIAGQILAWANKSVDETDGRTLRQVIALIFEKATDEAAFSTMYAKLCATLQSELKPEVKDVNLTLPDGTPVSGGALFRKYLLNRCQEDFERGWAHRDATAAAAKSKEADDRAKKESNEKSEGEAKEAEEKGDVAPENKEAELLSDEYYAAQKAKRRGLGLVRFIGELFKLSMISDRIMHVCVKQLLHDVEEPEEEDIESVCKLLTTVGKLLDGHERGRPLMEIYFDRMTTMASNPKLNSRIRFMILDIIELRKANWVPRHDNSGPKTIADVHREAAKQKIEQDREAALRAARGGPMSRGGSRRGQTRDSPDGWNTIGQAPPPMLRPTDLSKFGKGINRGGPTNIGSGPQSVFSKKGGKGTGSEEGSNPPTRTNSSSNIFALLSKDAEPEEPQRPKLKLQPRTKPLPGDDEKEPEGADEEAEEGEDEEEELAIAEISDEQAKTKIDNNVKEFLEVKNIEEGKSSIEALPVSRRPDFIKAIAAAAMDKNDAVVQLVAQLFGALKSADIVDDDMIVKGFKDHVDYLDDTSIDVPNAYAFAANMLVGSGLPKERIEAMTKTMEGEGIKTPRERLMEKVEALL
ncbi:hypothetical protein K437DRAFT_73771 [Tilletiaria anomala UBC 951]|uniref:MI domain-containing protein n=1 Tax=Tilletiaria anomala (strain ATCC 24038 / CBS 436.72 / UBC 951) TaxID=1037660 RepID=A0A066WFT0_TILAU|nr:uncharacterized protein K437DRAFT_73771 [Tilletiaria anomala UBC 951]KDN49919.1 hypothetical protein K437DRAFT_73771 [Tilletiaria anomala UBC 951]